MNLFSVFPGWIRQFLNERKETAQYLAWVEKIKRNRKEKRILVISENLAFTVKDGVVGKSVSHCNPRLRANVCSHLMLFCVQLRRFSHLFDMTECTIADQTVMEEANTNAVLMGHSFSWFCLHPSLCLLH